MMDKSREVEEQNRLREWTKENREEAKEIDVQAKKSSKWKGLRTIFSPSTSYQVFDFVEEEIEVTIVQMTTEKTTSSPNEDTQQSTETGTPNEVQEKGDERNVDASLKTPQATINVLECLISSQNMDGHIYQENGQKKM
jgi:hypothetical protein